jgi:hypothetical protein
VGEIGEDVLKLKAAVEFGSQYFYTIKNGGLGPTLVVDAGTKKEANIARAKIPLKWEGLYVIVIYCSATPEEASIIQ